MNSPLEPRLAVVESEVANIKAEALREDERSREAHADFYNGISEIKQSVASIESEVESQKRSSVKLVGGSVAGAGVIGPSIWYAVQFLTGNL